jgi:hypothetical protein
VAYICFSLFGHAIPPFSNKLFGQGFIIPSEGLIIIMKLTWTCNHFLYKAEFPKTEVIFGSSAG